MNLGFGKSVEVGQVWHQKVVHEVQLKFG